jgi:HEPN domain-containing protein
MRRPDDPELASWLQKAREDVEAVQTLSMHAPHLENVICFHCQQAAEKLLKALAVALDRPVPHTHDLDVLVTELLPVFPALLELRNAATLLKAHAVLPRYPVLLDPAVPPGAEARDARTALDAIQDVVSRILQTD